MTSEILEISTSRIDVAYEFVNESNEPVSLSVVFPLPAYTGALPSPHWGGQPPKFSLIVDGEARQFDVGIRATYGFGFDNNRPRGTDVTDELKAIGLSPGQIAILPGAFDKPGDRKSMFEDQQSFVRPVSPAQIRKLRTAGLLIPDPNASTEGEPDYPAWDVHVTYAWTITFPPGRVVSVKHSYVPFLALGSVGDLTSHGIEADLSKEFCASTALVARLLRQVPDGGAMPGAQVRYILQTANTWKGPIRKFVLRLKKSSSSEVISLCFPGGFVKVDALTLESRLENFSPAEDLHIQYLDPTRTIEYGKTLHGYGEAPRIPGGLPK
jgi:hypothetical protein